MKKVKDSTAGENCSYSGPVNPAWCETKTTDSFENKIPDSLDGDKFNCKNPWKEEPDNGYALERMGDLSELLKEKGDDDPYLRPKRLGHDSPEFKQEWKENKFKDYTNEMYNIFCKKNHDYTGNDRIGSSFDKTYDLLGPIAPAVRFLDKVFRYVAYAEGKEQLVPDEKVTDTLTDLANYALLTRLKIEWDEQMRKKKQELTHNEE